MACHISVSYFLEMSQEHCSRQHCTRGCNILSVAAKLLGAPLNSTKSTTWKYRFQVDVPVQDPPSTPKKNMPVSYPSEKKTDPFQDISGLFLF